MERFFDTEGVTQSQRMLHTPSGYARKHLCYIQEAGRLKSLKSHISSREGLESFLFLHVISGSGTLKCQEKTYELKSGDMALVDCREHYEHCSSEDDPWELEWVHFDGAKAEAFFGLFQKKAGESPVFRAERRTLPTVEEMMDTEKMPEPQGELTADLALSRLMLSCLEALEGKGDTADYERIRESLNEQAGTIADDSLEDMVENISGLSFERTDEGFTKRYGISVRDYLMNRRLNTAKELLRFTIKPVEEVSAEAGFQKETVFRELFLKYEEMSPEEYRKKWSQWIKG